MPFALLKKILDIICDPEKGYVGKCSRKQMAVFVFHFSMHQLIWGCINLIACFNPFQE